MKNVVTTALVLSVFALVGCASNLEGAEWGVYDTRWWSGAAGKQLEIGVNEGFPNINTVPPSPPKSTYGVLLRQLREGYKGDGEWQTEERLRAKEQAQERGQELVEEQQQWRQQDEEQQEQWRGQADEEEETRWRERELGRANE